MQVRAPRKMGCQSSLEREALRFRCACFQRRGLDVQTTRCHFVLTEDLHSVDESALHYEYVCKRVERREQVCHAMKA